MAYSLHPLLEDRIPPGLANDQVSPLHHHDTDKEGRVAGELHNLPLFIGLKRTRQTDEPGSPSSCCFIYSLTRDIPSVFLTL